MSAWIQTAAGSLIRGGSVTHVSVRESAEGWTVGVSAAAAPATFAMVAGQDSANSIRNQIAMQLDLAETRQEPSLIAWVEDRVSVSLLAVGE